MSDMNATPKTSNQQERPHSKFIPNTYATPTAYVDDYLALLTGSEWKVLTYAIRRIMGFNKTSDAISLSQFTNGITNRDGEVLDHGTGLCKKSVMDALDKLVEFNLLILVKPGGKQQAAEYALQLDATLVKNDLVLARHKEWNTRDQQRTEKARGVVSPTNLQAISTPDNMLSNDNKLSEQLIADQQSANELTVKQQQLTHSDGTEKTKDRNSIPPSQETPKAILHDQDTQHDVIPPTPPPAPVCATGHTWVLESPGKLFCKQCNAHTTFALPFDEAKAKKADITDDFQKILDTEPDNLMARLYRDSGDLPMGVDKSRLRTADKAKPVHKDTASNPLPTKDPIPEPAAKVERPKPVKQSKVNPIFNWVARDIFKVPADDVAGSAGRIGKVAGLIVNCEKKRLNLDKQPLPPEMNRALAEKLAHPVSGFVAFYQEENPNASLPLDADKFGVWYDKWRVKLNGQPLVRTRIPPDPNCPRCHGTGDIVQIDEENHERKGFCPCQWR